jgi:AcrR family transcriptional regulator
MDVAIDCFARHGYQATSIDRIARAAGVTKGALYYHFKDKEELLFAAVKNRVGQFERRVVSDTAGDDAPKALRRLARICFEHATKSNHRRLIVTLMIEALDTHPRLAAEFHDMMHRFRRFLGGIITAGQERGQFRSAVDARVAAEVFSGAIMGAEIQYYQDPQHFTLSATLDAFVEQFLAWLVAAPAAASRPPAGARRTRQRTGRS